MNELEQLAKKWNKAWFDKDAAFVDSMLAPNYVYVAPNGKVLDRKTVMGVITSPTYKLHRGSDDELQVIELAPDAAAVIRHWRGSLSFQGKSFNEDHRVVTIYVKRGRKWNVAYEQASPVKD